jgi:hypothetical protein
MMMKQRKRRQLHKAEFARSMPFLLTLTLTNYRVGLLSVTGKYKVNYVTFLFLTE